MPWGVRRCPVVARESSGRMGRQHAGLKGREKAEKMQKNRRNRMRPTDGGSKPGDGYMPAGYVPQTIKSLYLPGFLNRWECAFSL